MNIIIINPLDSLINTPVEASLISEDTSQDIKKNPSVISEDTSQDIKKNQSVISGDTSQDIKKNPSVISEDTSQDFKKNLSVISEDTSQTKIGIKNSSPYDILKTHTSQLLGVISGPDKLANDLSNVDLIPGQVKDDVLTTESLSRYEKCSRLLNAVQRSLKVYNEQERLILFCEVLKKQDDWTVSRLCDNMLEQLGVRDPS